LAGNHIHYQSNRVVDSNSLTIIVKWLDPSFFFFITFAGVFFKLLLEDWDEHQQTNNSDELHNLLEDDQFQQDLRHENQIELFHQFSEEPFAVR
jgi:hypothetical protein